MSEPSEQTLRDLAERWQDASDSEVLRSPSHAARALRLFSKHILVALSGTPEDATASRLVESEQVSGVISANPGTYLLTTDEGEVVYLNGLLYEHTGKRATIVLHNERQPTPEPARGE